MTPTEYLRNKFSNYIIGSPEEVVELLELRKNSKYVHKNEITPMYLTNKQIIEKEKSKITKKIQKGHDWDEIKESLMSDYGREFKVLTLKKLYKNQV